MTSTHPLHHMGVAWLFPAPTEGRLKLGDRRRRAVGRVDVYDIEENSDGDDEKAFAAFFVRVDDSASGSSVLVCYAGLCRTMFS